MAVTMSLNPYGIRYEFKSPMAVAMSLKVVGSRYEFKWHMTVALSIKTIRIRKIQRFYGNRSFRAQMQKSTSVSVAEG